MTEGEILSPCLEFLENKKFECVHIREGNYIFRNLFSGKKVVEIVYSNINRYTLNKIDNTIVDTFPIYDPSNLIVICMLKKLN